MKKKLSFEMLVAQFIKSGTNGRQVSATLRRILTVIVLPIWLIGFTMAIFQLNQGIRAYSEASEVKKELSYTQSLRWANEWPYSEKIAQLRSEERQLDGQMFEGFLAMFWYLLICFLTPWSILRITFWIIDADKTKPII